MSSASSSKRVQHYGKQPRGFGAETVGHGTGMTLEEAKQKVRDGCARMGMVPANKHWGMFGGLRQGARRIQAGLAPVAAAAVQPVWHDYLTLRRVRVLELSGAKLSAKDIAILQRQGKG